MPPQVSLREHDRGRYGRLVAEVFCHAGKNHNNALVEAGQAAVYPRYCRDSHYFDALAQAKADRRGIWEKTGEHQTPWTWRRTQAVREAMSGAIRQCCTAIIPPCLRQAGLLKFGQIARTDLHTIQKPSSLAAVMTAS